MLQSLVGLPDDQVDTVINAVTEWCRTRGVAIESDEGRQAISTAVNILSTRTVADQPAELHAQLAYPLSRN